MKLIESLIRQTALNNEVEELEAHQAIMHQFEYVYRAAKTDLLEIEISGIGYLTVNKKKLQKDIDRQYLKLEELLKEGDQEKIEKLQEDLKINESKAKKSLEKSQGNPYRIVE